MPGWRSLCLARDSIGGQTDLSCLCLGQSSGTRRGFGDSADPDLRDPLAGIRICGIFLVGLDAFPLWSSQLSAVDAAVLHLVTS